MTPLQVFLSVSGLILSVTFGLAVYLVPKHRVRQKFFDKALGNSGADGMPPHDDIFTILERVVHQLNGGGLGTQMTRLTEQFTDHVTESQTARMDLTDDVRAVKEQVAEVQRFGYRLAQGQERLEAQVASVDGAVRDVQDKVDGRLFDLEEAERTHRAALHELGYPTQPDEATPDPS